MAQGSERSSEGKVHCSVYTEAEKLFRMNKITVKFDGQREIEFNYYLLI